MTADPYWTLGRTTHGLALLGARDLDEVKRIGMDVVYSDHLRDTGGEPVVDVEHARVLFPSPPAPARNSRAIPAGGDWTVVPGDPPIVLPPGWEFTTIVDAGPPALPADEWPAQFAVMLARLRHDGLVHTRRLANEARARLGLLSADDEDNIIAAGGTVHGAQAWRCGSVIPIAAGAAAEPRIRQLVAAQGYGRAR